VDKREVNFLLFFIALSKQHIGKCVIYEGEKIKLCKEWFKNFSSSLNKRLNFWIDFSIIFFIWHLMDLRKNRKLFFCIWHWGLWSLTLSTCRQICEGLEAFRIDRIFLFKGQDYSYGRAIVRIFKWGDEYSLWIFS